MVHAPNLIYRFDPLGTKEVYVLPKQNFAMPAWQEAEEEFFADTMVIPEESADEVELPAHERPRVNVILSARGHSNDL